MTSFPAQRIREALRLTNPEIPSSDKTAPSAGAVVGLELAGGEHFVPRLSRRRWVAHWPTPPFKGAKRFGPRKQAPRWKPVFLTGSFCRPSRKEALRWPRLNGHEPGQPKRLTPAAGFNHHRPELDPEGEPRSNGFFPDEALPSPPAKSLGLDRSALWAMDFRNEALPSFWPRR